VEFHSPHRPRHLTAGRASLETATGLFHDDPLPDTQAELLRARPGSGVSEGPPLPVARVSA
jgi:hypothetical protein